MRKNHSKLFISVIAILSIILFFFILPFSLVWNPKILPLPFINTKEPITINFSNINVSAGTLTIQKELSYRLGLDLQGGVRLTYELDMKSIPASERQAAFESAREIIDKRINYFGVTEPTIQTLKVGDTYRIVVELPGVTDVSSAVDLIGRTAQLTFWEGGKDSLSQEVATSSAYPFGMVQLLEGREPLKTKLTGKDLQSAKVGFNSNTGSPEVQLVFTSNGSKLFSDITKRNVNKPVVIVLDDQVIQAPRVNEPITNGNAVITGGFTTETARSLSIQLNAGALPVPLHVVAQSNIGPSLGMESLKGSTFAGIIGFISLVIFMIYLYRKEGLLASIALLVYTIIVLFIFKLIPVTLTLAGIAGFILSIGMAVDANVLIFERMREEKRAGKGQDIAVEVGFKRAWSSIRDSNISSLLTAFILFYFGTGVVRGFALTLAIGILISMFTAIVVTRNLLLLFDKGKRKI